MYCRPRYSCPPNVLPSSCDCGVVVESTCSDCVTRLCSEVTFTVTVTNNCDVTIRDACLTVPLDGIFALLKDFVTVNGVSVAVEDLNKIPLGDIEVGTTATVTYRCVVMEPKRYVYTRAVCTFIVCCCCTKRIMNVASNTNLLQVCPCCGCCDSLNR